MQTTLSRNIRTMNVEFENVKFMRATTLAPQKEVEIQICIQLGSGHFELSEAKTLIVTGFVRVVENAEPIEEIQPEKYSDLPVVDQDAFYKELRLRGYHYDGIFRSVQCARTDGTSGQIRWVNDNWPAFMDCLLQLSIISNDSRALFLPTSIRKVRINPQRHYELLAELDAEQPVFDVQLFKEHEMVVGGGVEIIGLSVSPVGRRKPAGVEVWESHTFVPLNDPTKVYTKEDALRTIAQVVLENSGEFKVKLLEIDDGNDDGGDRAQPLVPHFDDVFAKMPLIDAELKIQTNRSIPDLDGKYIVSSDNQNNYHIIVAKNALDENAMLKLSSRLTSDGYILLRETNDAWRSRTFASPFSLIYALRTIDETFVLLRRLENVSSAFNVVEINPNDNEFNWLLKLQQSMKIGPPVLLVAQQNRLSGIMGLVNCIRKEPNCQNIRCLFVMDDSAPKYRFYEPFYREHLKLNLVMNIYKNGKWGTYRHLALVEWQETKPHVYPCWAQIARIGDLSSFEWRISSAEQRNTCDVDVHYASINFKDVMLATGRLILPEESRLKPRLLGFEFSGIDASGERVMGMLDNRGFSTRAKSFEDIIWRVPKEFTLREAATIPVAYITVYYAFFCVNRISRGQSILIHAGSGAVGLAAIRTAFAYGLEVYTTVSTPQKKKYIMDLFPKLKGNILK